MVTAKASVSPDERRALLADYFELLCNAEETAELFEEGAGLEAQRAWKHTRFHANEAKRVRDAYMASLESAPVSRCPFTAAVLELAIDRADLDGLWWEYDRPARPPERPIATFLELTGAMRMGEPAEHAPFLAMPGPEAPYVVPDALEHEAVKAVVSTVALGPHKGYAIAYFAERPQRGLPKLAAWGRRPAYWRTQDDDEVTDELGATERELDFDLGPWIERGKLLWIAPGDDDLELHDTPDGCPYLSLPGRRSFTYVQNGRVWSSDGP